MIFIRQMLSKMTYAKCSGLNVLKSKQLKKGGGGGGVLWYVLFPSVYFEFVSFALLWLTEKTQK